MTGVDHHGMREMVMMLMSLFLVRLLRSFLHLFLVAAALAEKVY